MDKLLICAEETKNRRVAAQTIGATLALAVPEEGDYAVYVCQEEERKVYFGKGKEYRRIKREYSTSTRTLICYGVCDPEEDLQAFNKDVLSFKEFTVNTEDVAESLKNSDVVAIDIETSGFNPHEKGALIYSVALSTTGSSAQVFSFYEFYAWYKKHKDLFLSKTIVGQNIKFELNWLECFGIDTSEWVIDDTQIREHMIDENKQKGLDSLVLKYTTIPNYWANFNYERFKKDCFPLPSDLDSFKKYNGYDTAATMQVYKAQKIADRRLNEFEMEVLRVLLSIEQAGMRIDTQALKKKKTAAKTKASKLKKEIDDYVASLGLVDFNADSPTQLGKYLYEIKKYPVKTTKSGRYSSNKEVIDELQEQHPDDILLKNLVEMRGCNKLVSTYYENIEKQLKENETEFIYAQFNQSQVVTWRLSSSGGINFQNIPARNSDAVESLFISRFEGGSIIKVDYSQMELRLLADISRDEVMLDAFNSGKDFHQATADIMGVDRNQAKTLNFKIVYGGGTPEEVESWFRAYPKAKKWVESTKQVFHKTGQTVSPLGHVRHLGKAASCYGERAHQERQAVNSPIQGFAGRLTLMGIGLLQNEVIKDRGLRSLTINSVHDSILIDAPKEETTEDFFKDIKNTLQNNVKVYLKQRFNYELIAPLKVDISYGPSWGEQKVKV